MIGDGAKARFWHDNWLDGDAPQNLAPHLFELVARKNRSVQQELNNGRWMHYLRNRVSTTEHIEEFVSLWIRTTAGRTGLHYFGMDCKWFIFHLLRI
jgi:hypothetical protein